MDMRFRRIMAIVMAAVLIITAAMLVSCKKSGSENGGSDPAETTEETDNKDNSGKSKPEEVDYDPAHSFVAGKCYVLSGMSSEDEEFDEDLIKEMFDIKDITEYMKLYFDKMPVSIQESDAFKAHIAYLQNLWQFRNARILIRRKTNSKNT